MKTLKDFKNKVNQFLTFKLIFVASFSFKLTSTFSQQSVSQITVSDSLLKTHVYVLASDSLQGRATGTTGQLKAANYCMAAFKKSHLNAVFSRDSAQRIYWQTYPFSLTKIALYGAQRGTFTTRYELIDWPETTADSNRTSFGHNLAGLLIGGDLRREVVVISAHYDHLGKSGSQVYYGADDDASGTATVLSIATLFDSLARQGVRPRRSILFVLFSGEENGLLGSQYFVENSPVLMKQITADLNVDMVGRVDYSHRKNPNYCYIIDGGINKWLRKKAEQANGQSVGLELDYTYSDSNADKQLYYRSDHYNFAKQNVPVLFFTNGEHPDYHRTSDTAERIDYPLLQKRATLVFQTAWLLAN